MSLEKLIVGFIVVVFLGIFGAFVAGVIGGVANTQSIQSQFDSCISSAHPQFLLCTDPSVEPQVCDIHTGKCEARSTFPMETLTAPIHIDNSSDSSLSDRSRRNRR